MNSHGQIAGCKSGNCPKVFVRGNRVFVQGDFSPETTAQFDPPAGEAVVEIPFEVLKEAADVLTEAAKEIPA
jgi:hypothetical protein